MNESSWFSIRKYFDKSADKDVLFGPTKTREKSSYMYPNESIKLNETVIWNPTMHVTVSLKSYERAHQEQDQEALAKITKIGCPLGLTFGGCIKLKKD